MTAWKSYGQRITIAVALMILVSCGGRAAGEPQFSGVTQPFRVPPSEVQDVILLPPGYESIGELSINCRDSTRGDVLGLLDTIDNCDASRLVDTLKQAASRAGGEVLVGRRCDSDTSNTVGLDHKPARSESIQCRAVVARRIDSSIGWGSNHGVPDSQLPPALRSTADAAPSPTVSPAVIEATAPAETQATTSPNAASASPSAP
jgi:hypothetical protein